jgi:hypothetical protein
MVNLNNLTFFDESTGFATDDEGVKEQQALFEA